MPEGPKANSFRVLGRYAMSEPIAAGGMASVHVARLLGPASFARTVAVKRLHPHLRENDEFVAMFLDEARLVSRIRHPNVVPTLDVVAEGSEVLLVMEYVHGESLAKVLAAARRANVRLPCRVVSSILCEALRGLHAAHDATSDLGLPLEIVHRDVSPQNILVGLDGIAHVVDFGIAKASVRAYTTRDGSIRGKVAYMAPEQLRGAELDRRTDVYAATVVLWESLTGETLFASENEVDLVRRVLDDTVEPPSGLAGVIGLTNDQASALDHLILQGLARSPLRRIASAHDLAIALANIVPPAAHAEVAACMRHLVGTAMAARTESIAAFERATASLMTTRDAHLSRPVEGEMTTEIAPMSVERRPGSRRAGRPYIAAAALAIVMGPAIGLGLTRLTRAPSPREAAAPAPREPLAAEPSSSSSSAVALEVATVTAPAVSTMPVPAAPAVRGIRTLRTGTKAPVLSPSASAVPADCDPPYTRDSSGVVLHKPQCFTAP